MKKRRFGTRRNGRIMQTENEMMMTLEPTETPRVEYSGGAQRSDAKALYNKLDAEWLRKTALALTEGELKYPTDEAGIQNWQKGGYDFLCAIYDHAYEHLLAINPRKVREEGYDFSEDHFGHCSANLMFLSWYFDKRKYIMPEDMDNLISLAEEAEKDWNTTPPGVPEQVKSVGSSQVNSATPSTLLRKLFGRE